MKYLVLKSIQRRPYIKNKFLEVLLEIIVLKVLESFSSPNICDGVQTFWSSKAISKNSVKVDWSIRVCQILFLDFQSFKVITKYFELIENHT